MAGVGTIRYAFSACELPENGLCELPVNCLCELPVNCLCELPVNCLCELPVNCLCELPVNCLCELPVNCLCELCPVNCLCELCVIRMWFLGNPCDLYILYPTHEIYMQKLVSRKFVKVDHCVEDAGVILKSLLDPGVSGLMLECWVDPQMSSLICAVWVQSLCFFILFSKPHNNLLGIQHTCCQWYVFMFNLGYYDAYNLLRIVLFNN